ncbi:hypothetical protein ACPXCE_19325 [Streptomyces sp. DT24]|nr:hypothetical protein [Streptomyces sp. AM 4-1-1]WEH33952.1 hypothetical protein PZB75_11570 [Streptomyces sp. AM 4-1-1]
MGAAGFLLGVFLLISGRDGSADLFAAATSAWGTAAMIRPGA